MNQNPGAAWIGPYVEKVFKSNKKWVDRFKLRFKPVWAMDPVMPGANRSDPRAYLYGVAVVCDADEANAYDLVSTLHKLQESVEKSSKASVSMFLAQSLSAASQTNGTH